MITPAGYAAPDERLVDRLEREYADTHVGTGMAPVSIARLSLRGSRCWQIALRVLRSNYDEGTAKRAWIELLAEPGSGWCTVGSTGQCELYCVPGYSALCGDAIPPECLPSNVTVRPPSGFSSLPIVGDPGVFVPKVSLPPLADAVKPPHFPSKPFRVPDETPEQVRVNWIQRLAWEGTRFEATRELAKKVWAKTCARGSCSHREIATEALRAAQSVGYSSDPPGEEWFQGVDYTIFHGGDCEDLAELLVSLLMILGVAAEVVWISQPGAPLNHVTARVWADGRWWWADPSIAGAGFGEHPHAAVKRIGAWAIDRVRPQMEY